MSVSVAPSPDDADSLAEPFEASVALDHVREQRSRERGGRALQREQCASGLLGRDRATSRVDQLDEPVCGVERQLHAATLYEHVFDSKRRCGTRHSRAACRSPRKAEGPPAGGPSAKLGEDPA